MMEEVFMTEAVQEEVSMAAEGIPAVEVVRADIKNKLNINFDKRVLLYYDVN